VQRLEEEPELVVIAGIQQLQIHPAVHPVPRRSGPRSPVGGGGLVEPAVPGVLASRGQPVTRQVRGRAASVMTAVRLAAPTTAGRAPAAARTHRTIVPDRPGSKYDPGKYQPRTYERGMHWPGLPCQAPAALHARGGRGCDSAR
jgi:hypothetical protein